MSRWTRFGIVMITLFGGAWPVSALETPRYRVERILAEGIEVRGYEPMLLAETTVATTDYRRAGNEGFRVLANYIFGDNQGRREIAMTAPVEQRASDGGWTVSFMMPSAWRRETLPLPNDPRVMIREVPGRRIAAIRFSGTWSARSFAACEAELVTAVTRAGLAMVGEPWTARYDPPWTPWFMRRNEILVELAPD